MMRAALLAVALGVAAAGGLLGASSARADHEAGGGYAGVTSEFGEVSLRLSADGATLEQLSVTYAPATVPSGCPTTGTMPLPLPVTDHAVAAGPLEANAGQRNVTLRVEFASAVATGLFTAESPGGVCPHRRVHFAALNVSDTRRHAAPQRERAYSGRTSFGGSLRIAVGADATTMSALDFRHAPRGCDYGGDVSEAVRGAIGAGGTFAFLARDVTNPAATFDVFGVFLNDGTARGVIAASAPDAACAPVVGSFTRAASGLITAGSKPPPDGGFGLFAFSGGTFEELVAASECASASASFYATNVEGEFVPYVPGAEVVVVNQAWNRLFPDGLIPPGTALLGKCA